MAKPQPQLQPQTQTQPQPQKVVHPNSPQKLQQSPQKPQPQKTQYPNSPQRPLQPKTAIQNKYEPEVPEDNSISTILQEIGEFSSHLQSMAFGASLDSQLELNDTSNNSIEEFEETFSPQHITYRKQFSFNNSTNNSTSNTNKPYLHSYTKHNQNNIVDDMVP